ncbi:MAG: hypothetical protein JNJ83_12920 [Verrucomicrobiaceae bacterium]|nr:hypothetical protein [Verrucomicrobiaceae bacterium]
MTRLLLPLLTLIALPATAEPRWYKGNTHTHTLWSDGDDFPEMIIDWYKTKGYDFLGLSDHNILQDKEMWMDTTALQKRRKKLGKPTMDKYIARFGDDWVETREKGGKTEVRLKKMDDYAPKFNEDGKFLLVKAEEISAGFKTSPIHINAVNIQETIAPVKDDVDVPTTIRSNLKLVADQARRLGIPILTHINHPNFRWGLTAEDLAAIDDERFFEIFNGHPMIYYEGDEHHYGHEMLWDIANTLRLGSLNMPVMYGVGTDDSHDYHGEESSPGRGWVVVRAEKLEATALVNAMYAGDFYASSGVSIDDVAFKDGKLNIRIKGEPGVQYTTVIRGTPKGYDSTTEPVTMPGKDPQPTRKRYSKDIGTTFATVTGTEVSYTPTGKELFFRAVITSTKPHPNPTYKGQTEMAWTQPIVGKP